MPIKIHRDLPAYDELTRENVFVMTDERAEAQDIRPLKIAIANLMPTTIDTETQLLRLLSTTPLQLDISLLRMGSHESHHAPPGHLEKFYVDMDTAMAGRFDALIITGAPVETLPYEDVDYWDELCRALDWADRSVYSTLHICWGAQAGLYHRYHIPKHTYPEKLFGIFEYDHIGGFHPLFHGFDDLFWAPQSRWTTSDEASIQADKRLQIMARSREAGPLVISARDCREIYVTGHFEYDAETLDLEYKRDVRLGKKINIPKHYYNEDNPEKGIQVRWRSSATLFYRNWLNMVYQGTPYDLTTL
jgi:homoserine O-succinyltransferase